MVTTLRVAQLGVAPIALGLAVLALPAHGQGPELTVAVQENPAQLDPVLLTRNVAYRVLPNVFETLIEVDYQNGSVLVPALATDWRRIDDRTMEFDLRRGVTFHDGSEMTADDVVFSFGEQRMGPDQPGHNAYRRFLNTIESVEAVDDHTVRVRTNAPDPILELRLSGWSSQIVSQDAFEAAGDWETWWNNPVGTGPFQVAEHIANDRLVLAAHDGYWGEAPAVDRVVFAVIPELSTRIAGLAAGDFDVITEVTVDQIETIEGEDGLDVVGGVIRNHRILNYDFDNPLLRDPRIREALNLAIDRQLIVDTIWQGRVEVTNGFQWPDFGVLYDPDREGPAYDPDRARALLAEAGYDGEPISYRIRNNYYPAQIVTAQAIAAMWQDVGFNIDMQILDSWDQVFAEPGTGIRDGSAPPLFADPISGLWRNYGDGASDNENWRNEQFDEYGQTLLYSLDPAERAAAHQSMLDIWHHEDPPGTILHALGQFYGLRDGVEWTPYNVSFMDLGANNLVLR